MAAYLQAHGFSPADALSGASARLYTQLGQQTQLLGFMDCFVILAIATLLVAPLILLTKWAASRASSLDAH